MTLRVSRTRRNVVVTMPLQCDLATAGQFVDRHIDWVKARLGSLPEPIALSDGAVVPLRGEPHQVVLANRRIRGVVVQVDPPRGGLPRLTVAGSADHGPRRLCDWLAAEARSDLEVAVGRHSRRLGLRPCRIAVRDQSSRWGSCSSTGVLSFSWRLVLAPPLVLDYVAAHEVAHLAEMNHGPRFWALVKRTMPGMEEPRSWLKACGAELHRYIIPD